MKNICLALVLVICWVATASAARVYLKDGSWLDAQRVWRDKGNVVVLVNRESITTFTGAEVDLKKTFPPRKKRVKPAATAATAGSAAAPAPAPAKAAPGAAAVGKTAVKPPAAPPAGDGKKLSMPSLPALPSKLPERELPKAGDDGAIRKQKKDMDKKLNE